MQCRDTVHGTARHRAPPLVIVIVIVIVVVVVVGFDRHEYDAVDGEADLVPLRELGQRNHGALDGDPQPRLGANVRRMLCDVWTRDMPTASVRAGRLLLCNANGGGAGVDREEGGLVAQDQENDGELGPRGAL